jgi:hypothetical protein
MKVRIASIQTHVMDTLDIDHVRLVLAAVPPTPAAASSALLRLWP